MTWRFSSSRVALSRPRDPRAVRALSLGAALAATFLAVAGLFLSEAGATPSPLRSGDASLLGVVDSVHASIVTVVCYPPDAGVRTPGGKRRRLIGTAIATSEHRIVTTASVAVPGALVHVLLGNGIERPAILKGVDHESNIALFDVEGATLHALVPAPPQSLAIGSWVAVVSNVAITHPQASLGRVVGRGQRLDYALQGDILEIDAPAYPGAAGGAVLNEEGDWVAVVVGRAGEAPEPSSSVGSVEPEGLAQAQSVLLALPVDQVSWISKQLETYGSVPRGFLGIRLRRVTVPSESLGVLVSGVVPGGPADSAGVRAGDRILAVDGQEVHTSEEVTAAVQGMRPGETVELTVLRETEIFPVRTALGATFPGRPMGPRSPASAEIERLRHELQRLDRERSEIEDRIRSLESAPKR
jgi:S1-C subfamily serine protease